MTTTPMPCYICGAPIVENHMGMWEHVGSVRALDTHRAAPMCPRCKGPIPNGQHPGAYPGALSRVDNRTYICSSCGVDEAMWQFKHGGYRDHEGNPPLPPLDQPVWWVDREEGDGG